ncbi:hypothetical protein A4G99_11005 [Haladaptatus sp. R4]|uniref:hypothetical protein n=1 Tax=Haladaptatus sp. R4 TaxID=1679489 RepID=UPI0007B4F37C|nr:hypothetical protein [Haladaptatus sp. R4]KZN24843.1 hypothetical protein A4G99_11005 [Haladaptatus sp. R4]
MTKVDDAILEWLAEQDIAAPPKVIQSNLTVPVSHSQVKRRIRVLKDNGLVFKDPERGNYYAITEIGRWYLDGAIGGEKLEALATTDEIDTQSLFSDRSGGAPN